MNDAPPTPEPEVVETLNQPDLDSPENKGKGCFFYGCTGSLAVLLIIGITIAITIYIMNRPITPTVLNPEERRNLDAKIEYIETKTDSEIPFLADRVSEPTLEETRALPTINTNRLVLTEREVNSIIGENSEFADKLKFDLQPDRIYAKFRYVVPDDAAYFPGKVFRFSAAMQVKFSGDDMDIRVKDIKIGIFKIPSAWLEGLGITDENIFEEIWPDEDSRKLFLSGIEEFEITDDEIIFVPAD